MKAISDSLKIIQGGMGVGVSNWRLAKVVSKLGQLGVVSGTGLETVVSRRLQTGDQDGHIRRALSHFPWPEVAQRVLDKYFISEGKSEEEPFALAPMPVVRPSPFHIELTVVSNFVEVFLAKEGHNGPVGINYLEKIQLPTLASLLGAMLAGVNFIMMGGGIPVAIPGILDGLARWEPVELRLNVEDNIEKQVFTQKFNPRDYFTGSLPELERPHFIAIVSSDIVAHSMIRRATGSVDGFVVEDHTAGGHNAPPRRRGSDTEVNSHGFSEKDAPNLAKIAKLGKPFWLAGGCASPERFQAALAAGAQGVQVGTAFGYCKDSGLTPAIREELLALYRQGSFETITDFNASPTGYPFKLIYLENSSKSAKAQQDRKRYCDLGYLRQIYCKNGQQLAYRCPAEPEKVYTSKGGDLERTKGKQCLCNGLLATIGLGQVRAEGSELPIITAGEDFSFLDHLLPEEGNDYTAEDVINYILG